MATRTPDKAVKLSVLDRLLDDEAGRSMDTVETRARSVQYLKDAVRRDLEWLLNTRRIAVPPSEDLIEVNRSVYGYGLPDLTSLSLGNPKHHAKLLRFIQTALKQYEPRLTNIRLLDLGIPGHGGRVLRLRIEGKLRTEPYPENVTFDTVLELASGAYEVEHA